MARNIASLLLLLLLRHAGYTVIIITSLNDGSGFVDCFGVTTTTTAAATITTTTTKTPWDHHRQRRSALFNHKSESHNNNNNNDNHHPNKHHRNQRATSTKLKMTKTTTMNNNDENAMMQATTAAAAAAAQTLSSSSGKATTATPAVDREATSTSRSSARSTDGGADGSSSSSRRGTAATFELRTSPGIEQLARRAVDLARRGNEGPANGPPPPYRQVLIGIAGGGGSGKTTVAEQVCRCINERYKSDLAIVIPMDGYHFSKAQLQEMADDGFISPNTGKPMTYDDLLTNRGEIYTFCPHTFASDLQRVRRHGSGSFALYDRSISDPVSNAVQVQQHHKIVLCEGLYLLAFDEEGWGPLRSVWDDAWYVHASRDVVRERLLKRNRATWSAKKRSLFGPGDEGIYSKVDTHDLPRSRWIESHSKRYADLIINNGK